MCFARRASPAVDDGLLRSSAAVTPCSRLPAAHTVRESSSQIERLLDVTQHQRARKLLQHRIEIFGLRLAEREEKPPHRVLAPEPLRSGDPTHNLVMENPLHMREATATHQHRGQKRQDHIEALHAVVRPLHLLDPSTELIAEPDPLEIFEHQAQPAPSAQRLGRVLDRKFAFPDTLILHRFVPLARLISSSKPS
jgi:hypothetical protein